MVAVPDTPSDVDGTVYATPVTGDFALQELSDRLQIRELLDTYAVGIDTRDWALLASCCTPDAVLDYTAYGGPKGSVQEGVDWIAKAMSHIAVSQHLVTNVRISLDGDTATSHCYLFSPLAADSKEGDRRTFLVGGYYDDRLRRTDDGWRLEERVAGPSWSYGVPGGEPRFD
jgi:hypothetical protein